MKKRVLTIILCLALCFSAVNFVGCKRDKSFTVTFTGGHEQAYLYYGEEVQVVTNSNQLVEPIYIREGYNFVGWNVSISRINKSTTVVAQWKKYPIEVVFYANGGKDDEGNRIVNITADSAKELIDSAPQFKKKGYSLSWSPQLGTITSSCSVNAVWTINEYNIVYKDKFGEDFASNTQKITFNQTLDSIAVSAPEIEGEKFAYWIDEQGLPIDKGIVWDIDNDLTLSPVYVSQDDFIINYDLDGGNRHGIESQRYYNQGAAINIINPTRKGYSFDGWQINGDSTKYLSSELSHELFMANGNYQDVTLKATWNNVPYTASLDADGGQVVGEQIEFFFGGVVPQLPTPQKENYEFVGWFYDDMQIIEGDVWQYAENITITAKYLAKYKVKFALSTTVGIDNIQVESKLVKWGDVPRASTLEDVEIDLLENQSLYSAKNISVLPVVNPIEEDNIDEYIFGNYWKYIDSQGNAYKILVNTLFNPKNLPDIKAGDTIILVPHIKVVWTPNY